MAVAIQIVTGCVLAALSLRLIRRCDARVRWRFMALWLIIAALIYVSFVLRTSDPEWWKTKLAGVEVFTRVAQAAKEFQ